MKKLTSMTDFVTQLENKIKEAQNNNATFQDLLNLRRDCFDLIFKYKNILKLTPEIWQFVPCKLVDGVWVVLKKPSYHDEWLKFGANVVSAYSVSEAEYCHEYRQAEYRCYFEGFEVMNFNPQAEIITNKFINVFWYNSQEGWYLPNAFQTLEDLVPYNLTLTATAQKEIGL